MYTTAKDLVRLCYFFKYCHLLGRSHNFYSFLNSIPMLLLTDWFARKNVDDTVIFLLQYLLLVRIRFVPLLTIFTLDGNHRVIFTLDDRITL